MNISRSIFENPLLSNINNEGIPYCECEPVAEEAKLPNITIILIFLPLLSFCGIFCNTISIVIFTKRSRTTSNSNIYLAGLSLSDIGICCSGLFIITADSLRGYIPYFNEIFAKLIPFLVPVGLIFQMLSVYITILASIDCYIYIIVNKDFVNEDTNTGIFKFFSYNLLKKYCTERVNAFKSLAGTTIFVFLYNVITFGELTSIKCYDKILNQIKVEVCPTSMRVNEKYIKFYKGYFYSFFMAGFPFFILSLLTIGILKEMKTKSKLSISISNQLQNSVNIHSQLLLQNRKVSIKNIFAKSNEIDEKNESSPVMLVMVVILFLLCNMVTLIVNYLETTENIISFSFQMILIDVANFLVVFNATANFFIYTVFSKSYRKRLKEVCGGNSDDSNDNNESLEIRKV
ncbi:FMRFamide receptor [Strongyloides ratti]|uniref:FMRFamide receptor n=1 Tax=Strongyloides ratti TaxID=34506 RepID=A0A090LKY7_STRRB|nr:FMRFamide receptor [Strongyloides ratti]CEF70494.1 FMRFamide receptor [Strongyloides ratti]